MNEVTKKYIESNIKDLRALIDYVEKGILPDHIEDINGLKLAFLSVAISENHERIFEKLDTDKMKLFYENYKAKRDSDFGKYVRDKKNVKEKRLVKVRKNVIWQGAEHEDDKIYWIYRHIRNGIAHSNYEYKKGVVRVSIPINGRQDGAKEFSTILTTEWLEEMLFELYSDKIFTKKDGEKIVVEMFANENFDLESIRWFVVRLKNGELQYGDLSTKISSKNMQLLNYRNNVNAADNLEELIRAAYLDNDLQIVSENLKEAGAITFEHLGVSKKEYDSLKEHEKKQLIKSKISRVYDYEIKHAMGYFNIFKAIEIFNKDIPDEKKQELLEKSGIDLNREYMRNLAYKAYFNFVYNYINTKFFGSNSSQWSEDIRHIRNAFVHNRVILNDNNITLYDGSRGTTFLRRPDEAGRRTYQECYFRNSQNGLSLNDFYEYTNLLLEEWQEEFGILLDTSRINNSERTDNNPCKSK